MNDSLLASLESKSSSWVRALAPLLSAAALLAGCSTTVTPGGSGGGAPGGGGAGAGDAKPRYLASLGGSVTQETKNGKSTWYTGIGATFDRTGNTAPLASGSCRQLRSHSLELVTAGKVTVKVGGAAAFALQDQSLEYGYSAKRALWGADTELTFDVEGSDDVPAFTVSLRAPEHLVLTAPLDPDPIAVELAHGLDLAWTPIEATQVRFEIGGTFVNDKDGGGTIECAFDAKAGSGTVSPETLAIFAPGEGSLGGVTWSIADSVQGDWLFSAVLVDDSNVNGHVGKRVLTFQ